LDRKTQDLGRKPKQWQRCPTGQQVKVAADYRWVVHKGLREDREWLYQMRITANRGEVKVLVDFHMLVFLLLLIQGVE